MTLKSTLFAKLLTIFWQIWGQQSRTPDFFKIVLKFFMKCSGILFGLNSPSFDCIHSYKDRYITPKIEILPNFNPHLKCERVLLAKLEGRKSLLCDLLKLC